MQAKQKIAYIALGCVLLLSSVMGIIDVQAQAPNGEGGTWTKKANMLNPRIYFSTSVADGKIYAMGGPGKQKNTFVEEYDPTTDTWTWMNTRMLNPKQNIITSAAGGKIYVMGGEAAEASVEEYDPATEKWAKKASMPTGRYDLAACTVNGKIYAIGGNLKGLALSNAMEEYDPVTDSWTKKADMPTEMTGLSASVVNGKIYAIGGYSGKWPDIILASIVEEYDPATNTWTRKADMPTARARLSTSAVNGKIYAIGGDIAVSPNTTATSVVEEYDPATDTWIRVTDMPTARAYVSTGVVDGKIYAIGGLTQPNGAGIVGVVEEYEPAAVMGVEAKTRLPTTWGKLKSF